MGRCLYLSIYIYVLISCFPSTTVTVAQESNSNLSVPVEKTDETPPDMPTVSDSTKRCLEENKDLLERGPQFVKAICGGGPVITPDAGNPVALGPGLFNRDNEILGPRSHEVTG